MWHDRLLAIVEASQFAELREDFVRYVGELFRAISGIKPMQHAVVTSDIDHAGSGFVGATEARVATAQTIWESRGTHEKGGGVGEVAKAVEASAVIITRALVGRAAAQVIQTCLPLLLTRRISAATGSGIEERLLGGVELPPAEGNACFGVRVKRENCSSCVIVLAGKYVASLPLFCQNVAILVDRKRQQFAAPIATVKPRLIDTTVGALGARIQSNRGARAGSMRDVDHRRLEGGDQLRRVLRTEKEAAALRCRALQEGIMDGLIIGEADGVSNNIVRDWLSIEIVQVWPQTHAEEGLGHVVQIVGPLAFVGLSDFPAVGPAGYPVVAVGASPDIVQQPAGVVGIPQAAAGRT